MSTDSVQIEYRTKLAAEPLDFEADFGLTAVAVWAADASIEANELRRPSTATESADGADHSTGWIYQAAAEGQTGPTEPAWATTGNTADGSVSWAPVIPGGASEDTLQSATWTQESPPDSALTITNQSVGTRTASATVSGGTSGNTYLIVVTGIRKSGNGKAIQLYLTVM